MPKGYPRAKIDPDADGIEMPTAAEVARWKSAHAQIQAKIKGLSARADQLMTLIAAAEPLVPERPTPPPKPAKPSRIKASAPVKKRKPGRPKKAKVAVDESPQLPLKRGRGKQSGTWTSVIHNILVKAGRGLTHSELRDELAKTHLAPRLAKSDKGFYGGIAKLAEKDPPLLAKYRGRLFNPPVHQKLIADIEAGLVPDLEDIPHIGNASPFRDAILDLMKSGFPEGATSAEVIETLRKNPALAGTVQRHPTHAYNVLARLTKNGELTKWNEKYYLGPKQKAA